MSSGIYSQGRAAPCAVFFNTIICLEPEHAKTVVYLRKDWKDFGGDSDQVARRAKVCHLESACLELRYCRWLRRYDDSL